MCFQINENDLLLYNGKLVAQKRTGNVGGRITPEYIVMHYDTASNETSAINWMINPKSKVSAHLHISRSGVVTQLAPFNIECWHAGKSEWKGVVGLNKHSIGIELQNTGSQEYTSIQILRALEVCKALSEFYPIKELVGHEDIAPGRKTDPGKLFPMDLFKGIVI